AGRKDAPLWKELCQLAQEIRGLPRHVSQHPGGMIISSRPLIELVPLERAAMEDRVVCQWDKDSCDDARFIKIDFLALGMRPIVGGAVNPYVRRREEQRRAHAAGRPYEPPMDHPLLRECLAETLGVILYQDQVLQVCQALAGFTTGQSEALRRAMSRRRSHDL